MSSYYTNSIVKTNVKYTYMTMQNNLVALQKLYPFLAVTHIGKSVLGNPIPCIKFGSR